jgi:hypothetical protein
VMTDGHLENSRQFKRANSSKRAICAMDISCA